MSDCAEGEKNGGVDVSRASTQRTEQSIKRPVFDGISGAYDPITVCNSASGMPECVVDEGILAGIRSPMP